MEIKTLYNNYKAQEAQYKEAQNAYNTVITQYQTLKTYNDVLNNDDLSLYDHEQIFKMQTIRDINECLLEEITDLNMEL